MSGYRGRPSTAGPGRGGTGDLEELPFGKVVRAKRFAMKPMSVEEAVVQMEPVDHAFYLFMNDATGDHNVLYRRNDGDYGLIEPEAA